MNRNGRVPFPTPGLGRMPVVAYIDKNGCTWTKGATSKFVNKWEKMSQEEKTDYFEKTKKDWRVSVPCGDILLTDTTVLELEIQDGGVARRAAGAFERTPGPYPGRPARPPTPTPATNAELCRCRERLAKLKKQLEEHKAIREAGGQGGYHWTEFTTDEFIERQEERVEDLEKKCKKMEEVSGRSCLPQQLFGEPEFKMFPTTDEGFTLEDLPERFRPTPTPGRPRPTPPGMRPVPFPEEEGRVPVPMPTLRLFENPMHRGVELKLPEMKPPKPKPKPVPTRPTGMRPAIPTPSAYTGPQLQPGGGVPGGIMTPLTGAQFTLGGGFQPRMAQGPFLIPPSFGVDPDALLEPLRAEIRGLYGRLPPEEKSNVAEDLAACNLMAAQGEYEDAFECLKVVYAETGKKVSEYEKIPLDTGRKDPDEGVSPWVYGAVGAGVLTAIFALR